MTPDIAAVARTGDRSVDFLFENPEISTPPKDAPTRYQWQRLVEYSDFADWAAVSRHFAPLFAKAAQISEGSPLEAEARRIAARSEEHTSELQSLMRISYAVFCLKKKKKTLQQSP